MIVGEPMWMAKQDANTSFFYIKIVDGSTCADNTAKNDDSASFSGSLPAGVTHICSDSTSGIAAFCDHESRNQPPGC